MKKNIFLAALFTMAAALGANAQDKTAGIIEYQRTITFQQGGQGGAVSGGANTQIRVEGVPSEAVNAQMRKPLVTSYELLFNKAKAKYSKIDEPDDNFGGGGGGGGMRMVMAFGGGGDREYYLDFAAAKLTEVFEMNDTTYFMDSKLGNPTATVTKTDETKSILGYNCKKAVVKTVTKRTFNNETREFTDESTIWYTTDLGFNFSPAPTLWTEGTVLAIEGKRMSFLAKSIKFKNIKEKDLTLPKKGTPITEDQIKTKMENMMKRFRGNGRGGNNRTIRIGGM